MKNYELLMKLLRTYKTMNIKPNYSAIAAITSFDRRTVKKYYEHGCVPPRKKKKQYSCWDPYEDIIKEKLAYPGATIRGIHAFLGHRYAPVPGTYESLKAYIKKKGFLKGNQLAQKAHVHYETPIGHQIQVDWIEKIKFPLRDGTVVTFNIYSATMSWSREHILLYAPTVTEEEFIRCTVDTFRKLGGVPAELLTDNMSAIVNVKGGRKKVHTRIAQFFKDIGVELRLCKVRTPQTKGKVESANRFQSRLIPYHKELESEEEIRHLVENTITHDINQKINETTGMPPEIMFCQKEKEHLKPLPPQIVLESYLKAHAIRTVPPTLLVSFNGSGYSVPKEYINKRVHLFKIEDRLHIYNERSELITIHSISKEKKNYHLSHYEAALANQKHAPEQTHAWAQRNLAQMDEYYSELRKEAKDDRQL